MDASISPAALTRSLPANAAPLLIDVRREPVFLESPALIRGALRRDPDQVAHWARTLPRARDVVVYCVHGHQVSQDAARALVSAGIRARYREGGIEAWRGNGGATVAKPVGVHVGERCSFDAFVERYRLGNDPAMRQLAAIVRGADTDRLGLAPQSAGLLALSSGLSRLYPDDLAMLEQGMVMYDALYAWCCDGNDGAQTWNPQANR